MNPCDKVLQQRHAENIWATISHKCAKDLTLMTWLKKALGKAEQNDSLQQFFAIISQEKNYNAAGQRAAKWKYYSEEKSLTHS